MAIRDVSPKKDLAPKRRAHRKSRQGCGNCKFRRVKCDEKKPRCQRCISYGVECSYNPKSSDLELSMSGVFSVEMPQKIPCSLNEAILSVMNAQNSEHRLAPPESNVLYRWDLQDLELLDRFQSRTVLTMGQGSGSTLYRDQVMRLACFHPFLMHLVLTMTLLHDRHLSGKKASTAEAFHWYQGTALFNHKLDQPIQDEDRDAFWATAALLGGIAFSMTEAITPEESWPLKPYSPSDLDWLNLSDGKKVIWEIANPRRPDSAFRDIAAEHDAAWISAASISWSQLQILPPELLKLCKLGPTSDNEHNPYFGAASILAYLQAVAPKREHTLRYLAFLGNLSPEYRLLLDQKDPAALLLLVYWYARLVQFHQWWLWWRPKLEGQAICIYLQRFHSQDRDILELLDYPRRMIGLDNRQRRVSMPIDKEMVQATTLMDSVRVQ